MAKTLSSASIATSNTILAWHVTQSIDALTGTDAYDITISGSLQTTGSVGISGLLSATPGVTHQLTASNAVSSSFASSAISASYADNVPPGSLPSGLLSSSAQIASDISGAFGATSASLSSRVAANEVVTAKTLVSSSAQIATEISGAFGAASASFSTRVSANETNISTNTTNITTLTSKTGSYATTGSNQFNGDQIITGSLIVSGSTTSTIDANRVRIGDYFINGGVAVSQAEELYLSGSGVQRAVIESSDTAAILQLKSPTGKSAAIDFEEGPDQRWIVGLSASNDNFVIATGSALSEGVLFQVNRTSKDVEVINNLSASAVSASTYYGDGSNLSNISTTPFPFTGDAVITGSLLISGSSQYFRVDADDVVIGYGAGANLDSGTDSYNVLIGYEAGHTLDNDNYTVLIGYQAGKTMDHSGGINYNTMVGYAAGASITAGNKNVGVGYLALNNDTSGENVAIGHQAGQQGVGNYNVAIGGDAMRLGSTGTPDKNVAIGYQAGENLQGNENILIGYQAGDALTTGTGNLLIGTEVAASAVGASGELRIGSGSVIPLSASLTTGYLHDVKADNLTVTSSGTVLPTIESSDGIAALKLKSGGSHAYIDMDEGADQRWIAGMYTNDNSYRIASGSAFASNTLFELDQDGKIEIQSNLSSSAASTASFGTYIGDGSQLSNISTSPFPFTGDAVITGSLTISGSQAFVLDSSNVVLGQNAGGGTVDTGTDDGNVIIGKDAAGGGALNSGDNNIVIGRTAGYALSTGDNNIIIGFEAGKVNTATANTFIGSRSGQKNTTGYYNTFVGRDSGMECVEWQNNTYVGYSAGKNPQNEMNTAVGSEALLGASGTNTAEQNVALGYRALYSIASNGDGNVAVGYQAGYDIAAGTHNINIGFGATSPAAAVGDIRIGSGSIVPFSGSSVTGDVLFPSTASAAYFSGDGSNLTNVVAFPFVGDAVITGSLIVSSSNSTSSLSLKGSGSTVFNVAGSQGQLFSVTDDLSGTLFEANNISGLPVIQASADNTVHLGKWNGYGITISGSTPDPADADAKIMITGSVYHSGSIVEMNISGSITNQGIRSETHTGSPHTLGFSEHLVKLDSSGGVITVNLPDSATYPGRQIFFKVISGGSTITLAAAGSDNIDGSGTDTTLNATDESLSIISDGAGNWYIF